MVQEKDMVESTGSPSPKVEKAKVEKPKVSQGSMPESRQEEHKVRVLGPAKYNGGRP